MIVTATEVTLYTNISATAGTISSSGLIPIVQERINLITNNYFESDMYLQESMTFDATAYTITADNSFADEGFLAGDDIYIYNSYRNDGYHTVESVADEVLTITSTTTLIAEVTTRSIYCAVVAWPNALKYIAAQMVKYDYDDRIKLVPGVTSESLGPYSYSLSSASVNNTPFGYPQSLIDSLSPYTAARIV